MSNTNARLATVKTLQDLGKGHAKLASMVREMKKQLPTPAQLLEVKQSRDVVTSKLASLGLIEQVDAAAFRTNLDSPGGAEHLLNQLLDRQASEKTASNEPRSELGYAAPRTQDASGKKIPSFGYVVGNDGRRQSYQAPYHA